MIPISQEISGVARAYFHETWTDAVIHELVRSTEVSAHSYWLATRRAVPGDPSEQGALGEIEAGSQFRTKAKGGIFVHERVKSDHVNQVLPSHRRRFERPTPMTKTELFMVMPGERARADSFDVFVMEALGLTELSFGGTYVDRGNDEFLTRGGLDEEMGGTLRALEHLARWRCPAFAWLGRGGGYVEAGETAAALRSARPTDPDLRWVTVFGPPYVDALGRDFLLQAPGYRVVELENGGIFYQITKDFLVWDESDPKPKDVENYFRQAKGWEKVRYRPVLAKGLLSPKGYARAIAARTGTPVPPASVPRHRNVADVGLIPELIRPVPRLAKESFGVALDFTPASIRALDEAMNPVRTGELEELDDEAVEDIALGLGLYVGEVVVRNLGGRWAIAEEPPSPRLVGLPGIEWLDPVGRMEKRLVEGEAASLVDWYQAIERRIPKREQPGRSVGK